MAIGLWPNRTASTVNKDHFPNHVSDREHNAYEKLPPGLLLASVYVWKWGHNVGALFQLCGSCCF